MFEKNSIAYQPERTLRAIGTLLFDIGDLSSISVKAKGNGKLYACDDGKPSCRRALIDTKASKKSES